VHEQRGCIGLRFGGDVVDPEELEQSEELERALDELLHGREPQVSDPELKSLLEVARKRYQLALDLRREAEKHRQRVWQLIEEKLRRQNTPK